MVTLPYGVYQLQKFVSHRRHMRNRLAKVISVGKSVLNCVQCVRSGKSLPPERYSGLKTRLEKTKIAPSLTSI